MAAAISSLSAASARAPASTIMHGAHLERHPEGHEVGDEDLGAEHAELHRAHEGENPRDELGAVEDEGARFVVQLVPGLGGRRQPGREMPAAGQMHEQRPFLRTRVPHARGSVARPR